MKYRKNRILSALVIGLAVTASALLLSSITDAGTATPATGGVYGHDYSVAWDGSAAGGDPEACTIAVAIGEDGRPVAWKNRDFFGRPDAWQSILFRHEATGWNFPASEIITDRFDYVAVSDWGDWSDPQDITETLRYPRMGANEKGLGVVQAQAHTLSCDVQTETVGTCSQDSRGIRNGGLTHWILSRCETITDVETLLAETNDGGGYNGSKARNTATLIAVFDRFGGAAIFEVDGNSYARQNITQEFDELDERLPSIGPPAGVYTGFDYRTNFSRIAFTNTNIGFPYFPDVCTNTVVNNEVVNVCEGVPDGINDLEDSTSSVKRWGRVANRMDDAPKDYQYFTQKWLRAGGQPREYYLETVARSVGYEPYLTTNVDGGGTPTRNWKQEKPTGWHLDRFVTVSAAVIVGSGPDDLDEGKLTTMWVALGEPSVAIFVPVFPYAGQPPAILDEFFLATNAKRRLVYDYETDAKGYPVDNIDAISSYTRWRNADHSINLSALFGGNYYGEGGLQAYHFAIEEELYQAYQAQMATWRTLTAEEITPAMLSAWQTEQITWAVEEYVKGDPSVTTYEAEDGAVCVASVGEIVQLDEYSGGDRVDEWAWQTTESGYLSCTHPFAGLTIVEVIAKGEPGSGQWPKMKVWAGGECLTEVGGETESDCSITVSPMSATHKAKDVGSSDVLDPDAPRFAMYRYRAVLTGTIAIKVEAVDATSALTLSVDKIIVRTEPHSVEMYEVEKDWDAKSDTGIEIADYSVLLKDTVGYLDIHHYAWGVPMVVEVVARGFSTGPAPVLSVTCDSQLIGSFTPTTTYTLHAFTCYPDSAGPVSIRLQTGNYKDVRVDKLLVKERLPVDPNAAPIGYFTVYTASISPTEYVVTATAKVTDPDGDAVTSYFWNFDGQTYCSGNPVVTHTYSFTETPTITLYATDHRGKTATIYRLVDAAYLPVVLKDFTIP